MTLQYLGTCVMRILQLKAPLRRQATREKVDSTQEQSADHPETGITAEGHSVPTVPDVNSEAHAAGFEATCSEEQSESEATISGDAALLEHCTLGVAECKEVHLPCGLEADEVHNTFLCVQRVEF